MSFRLYSYTVENHSYVTNGEGPRNFGDNRGGFMFPLNFLIKSIRKKNQILQLVASHKLMRIKS